jgi:hypothetical protein
LYKYKLNGSATATIVPRARPLFKYLTGKSDGPLTRAAVFRIHIVKALRGTLGRDLTELGASRLLLPPPL